MKRKNGMSGLVAFLGRLGSGLVVRRRWGHRGVFGRVSTTAYSYPVLGEC